MTFSPSNYRSSNQSQVTFLQKTFFKVGQSQTSILLGIPSYFPISQKNKAEINVKHSEYIIILLFKGNSNSFTQFNVCLTPKSIQSFFIPCIFNTSIKYYFSHQKCSFFCLFVLFVSRKMIKIN